MPRPTSDDAAPVFRKRRKLHDVVGTKTTLEHVWKDEQATNDTDTATSIDELVGMRECLRRRTGIQLEQLNKGEMDADIEREKRAPINTVDILVRQANFERASLSSDSPTDPLYVLSALTSRTRAGIHERKRASTTEAGASSPPRATPTPTAPSRAPTARFVPEVDLGINARMQNVEATEKAKQAALQSKKGLHAEPCPTDTLRWRAPEPASSQGRSSSHQRIRSRVRGPQKTL